MNLGRRERVHFPAWYQGFRLIRTHGRVFGIPPSAQPEQVLARGELFTHPSVISTATLEEMQERIDRHDDRDNQPQAFGEFASYGVYRHRNRWHGVPREIQSIDLDWVAECRRLGVLSADSRADLETKIEQFNRSKPVEFAGWLPIFEYSGNCGKHPQFTHTGNPPIGYRFTESSPKMQPQGSGFIGRTVDKIRQKISKAYQGLGVLLRVPAAFFRGTPGVAWGTKLRILGALIRMLFVFLRRGGRLIPTLRFLQSRHLQSQLLLGNRKELVFLTSMPYTYGQNPWVIEIEDPTTLFYPLIQNGNTGDLSLRESPYFANVKILLEHDSCKAIMTHIRSTAEMVATLFQSEIIRRKVVYAPLGVKLPRRWQRHEPQPADEPIELLFINSWCQVPENFYLRGGLDILEAFATLRIRYPQVRLTLRTNLPALADHYHRIIESGWVRVINRFFTAEEMAEIHANSHIFLLPAARVHIVSLLQAMSYGLAVVGSDGWGMEEYLRHNENGLIVRGRYGKVSWADTEEGMLRENYQPMYTSDPVVVEGIVAAVSQLIEDRALRSRLGHTARKDAESKYNLEQWNEGLRAAFDRAGAVAEDVMKPTPTMSKPIANTESPAGV